MNQVFVGQGHGAKFGAAVMNYFQESTEANHLRVVVQSNGSLVAYTVLLQALGRQEVAPKAAGE